MISLLVDGYRVVFERKCLFEINLIDPEVLQRVGHEISEPEELLVKILVKVSLDSFLQIRVLSKITPKSRWSYSVRMTTSSCITTHVTFSPFQS